MRKTDTAYAYDALNRPLGIDYPGTEADVVYRYDGKRYVSACCKQLINWPHQKGRLTAAWRGGVPAFWLYDPRGYPPYTWAARADGTGTTNATLYECDPDGQLAGLSFLGQGSQQPYGRHLAYRRDAAGRVDRVTLTDYDGAEPASRVLADAIRHLPFGPAKSLAYGNGLAYAYGATGSRTADYRDGAETLYGLDSQKLLSLSGAKTDALAHDANGNVAQAGGMGDGVRLRPRPAARRRPPRRERNRPLYLRCPRPARRQVQRGGRGELWLRPQGRLLTESGPPAAYAWLDGEPLARLGYAPDILYYHNTPLGTPHTATDATGQVACKADAEPFGLAASGGAGTRKNVVRSCLLPCFNP